VTPRKKVIDPRCGPRSCAPLPRAYEDKAPYAFTGTVKKVVFDLTRAHPEAEADLHQHEAMHALGHGTTG
jgi:hypothetical protein